MPEQKEKDRRSEKELKVTDRRIFTADGDIRDEYRENVKPAEPQVAPLRAPEPPIEEDKKKKLRDKGENPGTPFTMFVESLIANAYMSMGMLRNPYQPQTKPDLTSARQMIDIVNMLAEKTAGNLTEEEQEFLTAHLGSLKMAYVQLTKAI